MLVVTVLVEKVERERETEEGGMLGATAEWVGVGSLGFIGLVGLCLLGLNCSGGSCPGPSLKSNF